MSVSYIIDTSSLIELYLESERGTKVFRLIRNAQTLVPSIVVSELESKLERMGVASSSFIQGIRESSKILDLTFDIASRAGKKHAQLRKKYPNISLADCIVMVHAENEKTKIITADQHFRDSPAILV